MIDFNDLLNSGISDELLAAYIDGNTTESENQLIENSLNGDSMLSEAYEIASDSTAIGDDSDWDIYKGDFGFWELGLPPLMDNYEIGTQNQNNEILFGGDSNIQNSDYNMYGEMNDNANGSGMDDPLMSSGIDDMDF